jgi:hypothetical protein
MYPALIPMIANTNTTVRITIPEGSRLVRIGDMLSLFAASSRSHNP